MHSLWLNSVTRYGKVISVDLKGKATDFTQKSQFTRQIEYYSALHYNVFSVEKLFFPSMRK